MVTAVGVTWQHSNGLSLGAGVTYRFDNSYSGLPSAPDVSNDAVGVQFRVGFHRGIRVFAPPAPAVGHWHPRHHLQRRLSEAAPPPPAAAAKPQPTPACCGTPQPRRRSPSSFPSRSRTSSSIPHQSTLQPEALAVLQRAIEVLRQNPALRMQIEGHASEEATQEYNLALGAPRGHGSRLPGEQWRRRLAAADGQLRRTSTQVRQFAGRDASPESSGCPGAERPVECPMQGYCFLNGARRRNSRIDLGPWNRARTRRARQTRR